MKNEITSFPYRTLQRQEVLHSLVIAGKTSHHYSIEQAVKPLSPGERLGEGKRLYNKLEWCHKQSVTIFLR
jgi:hypothetical protein